MEVENILVVVCIWTSGAALGNLALRGGELYKVVLDRARELLTTIHEQILATQMEIKRQTEQEWQSNTMVQGKRKVLGAKVFHMGQAGSTGELNKTTVVGMRKPSPFKTSTVVATKVP